MLEGVWLLCTYLHNGCIVFVLCQRGMCIYYYYYCVGIVVWETESNNHSCVTFTPNALHLFDIRISLVTPTLYVELVGHAYFIRGTLQSRLLCMWNSLI